MVEPPLLCVLTMPDQDKLFDNVKANARYAKRMIAPTQSGRGKTLAICGAGPSLQAYVDAPPVADEVWACNSGLPFLADHHARVTHGVGIDQGEGMLEDWARTFDVTYLIASSVHPRLVAHLRGANRRLRWFHNFLGLPDPEGWNAPDRCRWCGQKKALHGAEHDYAPLSYELWLYQTLYAPSVQPQYGLNVVARALCLAVAVGYGPILIYGSDCAAAPAKEPIGLMPMVDDPAYAPWLSTVRMYADGRTALQVYGPRGIMVQSPVIEGRHWYTRADMVITAQHIADIIRWFPQNQISLVGDTLPGAFLRQPAEFFEGTRKVPMLDGKGAIAGFTLSPEQRALMA